MAKVRVQEFRKLMFPIETVVDAVLELDRSHGGNLALGRMTEVRVETGADPGLSLVVMQGAGSSEVAAQKRYTLPAVAAALIHYCFRARIPLPRAGTKSIEILPEGFQLTIHHMTEMLRLHGEAPQASLVEVSAAAVAATGDAALDDPTAAPAADADPEPASAEAPAAESPAPESSADATEPPAEAAA